MEHKTNEAAVVCAACDEPRTHNPYYPQLCTECCDAALGAEMMDICGGDWAETHADMFEQALVRLKTDKASIRVIRRYPALLKRGVASAIFLGDPSA